MNRRVFYHRQSWHSHLRRPAVSLLCLAFGVAGVLFGLIAMSRPASGPRCKEFEVRTVSVSFAASGIGGIADDRSSGGTTKRRKVMGFVGIQTGFGSFGRRRSLRKTWMPSDHEGLQRLEEATGLVFRFVIGKTSDSRKMSDLRKEVEEYDDFMLLDIEEEYSNLPHKTLAFFKSAYGLYDADFYVKADDDIYLRPDRLSVLLAKERQHTLTYLGCMKKGQVFTDPKLKWYEPLSHLLGSEYFLHAYGPIYALSAEVVTNLVALRNDSFRMFSNEDVTIGAWMLAMNVNHENNMALCETSCSPSSIAVWDLPKCSVPSDMMLLASCMGEVIQGLQEVLSLLGKYCFGEACFKNKSAMLLKWYGALQTGRAATKPSSDGGLFGNSNQSLMHDIVTGFHL